MKKTYSLIVLLSLFLFSFNSCKKCVTCRIEQLDGTIEAEYNQFCGTSKEVDEFQSELEGKTNVFIGEDGVVICVDDK
jgi:hypothetical protein